MEINLESVINCGSPSAALGTLTPRKDKMGNQKTTIIGEQMPEEIGGPIAEHHGKKEKGQSQKGKVEKKIKEKKFEKKAEVSDAEAIGEVKSEKSKPKEKEAPQSIQKKKKVGKAKVRSKKYQEASALVDRTKKYDLAGALELVKKTTLTKFDGNVELHVRLVGKSGKPETLRGFLKYPHSTGKVTKVVILNEKIAEEIAKTGKVDFDIALAAPEMMPKIAKLAKILGPKGKMPNPKSGTVTTDPEKTKAEFEGGQLEYKTDQYGSIHQVIGKVSANAKALTENFETLIAVVPKEKIDSLTICATMGPGIKVQL